MPSNKVTCFRDFNLTPLAGAFDARTQDGRVRFQDYRISLNFAVNDAQKRCRLGGWIAYGSDSPFGKKDQDLHDQLLGCLFYKEAFDSMAVNGGDTIGSAYPYWFPPFQPASFAFHDEEGPYCGYAPSQEGLYPTTPVLGQRYICDAFYGDPYVSESNPENLRDNRIAWTSPGNDEGALTFIPDPVQRGLEHLDAIEAGNGPSTEIDDARFFLTDILAPGIANSSMPQGTTNGVHGTITWAYFFEHRVNAETGQRQFVMSLAYEATVPFLVYPECNTGAPDFFTNSYYSLCYDWIITPDEEAGYGYGPLVPVISPVSSFLYQYCGDEILYREACREPITLLFEPVSISGKRKLIAGTKSRLYLLNERGGNWRVLADGLGGLYAEDKNCVCVPTRFKAAQLGNFVIFVNGVDPVMSWQMDEGPSGCNYWSAHYVNDLFDLGIQSAKVITEWEGFVFIADVLQDAQRRPYRIFWSDFNAPLSWAPDNESLAGFQDLGAGEKIVAMLPIGGQMRVYTRKGDQKVIYEVALVGPEQGVFNFREIYRGPDGPEYDNSIVNTGKGHFWFASSGLFVIGEFERVPRRLDWIHKADAVVYNGVPADWLKNFTGLAPFGPINKEQCEQAVGGFDSTLKAIWFSWPTDDNVCPNMTLVLFPEHQTATLVDHGFTAFVEHRPDYASSLRDFLAEFAGCNPELFLVEKEGDPYSFENQPPPPSYIRNYGEDPDAPVDPDSFCARLNGQTVEELCRMCDANSLFLMASAEDRTIKQFTPDSYYREEYIGDVEAAYCPHTTVGVYERVGYTSMLQGDAYDYGKREEKMINYAAVDFDAEEQTTTNLLNFQVAYGQQPGCMRWADTTPRELECLTAKTDEEHEADNTRANRGATFPMYRAGSFLAWRFYIEGTGGGSCFNEVTLRVRTKSGKWE